MSLVGKGKLHQPQRSQTVIYLGAAVANDSAFPFEKGQELRIEIDPENKRLIIESA